MMEQLLTVVLETKPSVDFMIISFILRSRYKILGLIRDQEAEAVKDPGLK